MMRIEILTIDLQNLFIKIRKYAVTSLHIVHSSHYTHIVHTDAYTGGAAGLLPP